MPPTQPYVNIEEEEPLLEEEQVVEEEIEMADFRAPVTPARPRILGEEFEGIPYVDSPGIEGNCACQ